MQLILLLGTKIHFICHHSQKGEMQVMGQTCKNGPKKIKSLLYFIDP